MYTVETWRQAQNARSCVDGQQVFVLFNVKRQTQCKRLARREGEGLFYIIDTLTKKSIGNGLQMRCNAVRKAQSMNIRACGIEEMDKAENERRYIIREREGGQERL